MQVPINQAKTQLSKLIEASLAGEDVVIARGQKPRARRGPVANGFSFGPLKDVVGSVPDFEEPMSDEDLTAWGEN